MSRGIQALLAMVVAYCLAHDSSAIAQAPTTVQLPSFSSFSYNGTVLVPDSGAAHLGSVNRSATGLNRRGLSRGFGQQQSIGQASAHVQIIDNAEIDRQILGMSPSELRRRELALERHAARSRVTTSSKQVDPDAEGKALVRHARSQYKAGKQSASFTTYRRAIAALKSPKLQELATAEFKRVFGSSADQILRMTQRLRN